MKRQMALQEKMRKEVSEIENEAQIQLPDIILPNDIQLTTRPGLFYAKFFCVKSHWSFPASILRISEVSRVYNKMISDLKQALGENFPAKSTYITAFELHIGAEKGNIVVLYRPLLYPMADNAPGTFLLPNSAENGYTNQAKIYYRNVPDENGNNATLTDVTGQAQTLFDEYYHTMRSYKTETAKEAEAFISNQNDPYHSDTKFTVFPFQEIFGVKPNIDPSTPTANPDETILVTNVVSLCPVEGEVLYKHDFILEIAQTDGRTKNVSNINHTSMFPPGTVSVTYGLIR